MPKNTSIVLKYLDFIVIVKILQGGSFMKKVSIYLLTFMLLSFSALGAQVLQLSLPGNNIPDGQNVNGARLSLIYGQTSNVQGLNVSILGVSEVDNFTGLELDYLLGVNRVKNEFKGIALGWINWHERHDTGLNFGLINYVNNVNGVNLGGFNFSQGATKFNIGAINIGTHQSLVDVGFFNYSESATFQLGLLNATKRLDGIQLGLINLAENGAFPVLPFINFKNDLYTLEVTTNFGLIQTFFTSIKFKYSIISSLSRAL